MNGTPKHALNVILARLPNRISAPAVDPLDSIYRIYWGHRVFKTAR